jgi:hypothetical protein
MADTQDDLEEQYTKIDDPDHLAYAIQGDFCSDSAMNNLSRYEARLERAFYKALHELERLRRESPPAPQIGSVSQKPRIVPPRPPEPATSSPLPPPESHTMRFARIAGLVPASST